MRIRRVTKRDGRSVPFDKVKIAAAVRRAQAAVGADDERAALDVADIVELALTRRYVGERTLVPSGGEAVPGIEEIQDLVEQALIELGHAAVAKAYILYRDRRARVRAALDSRSDAFRETTLRDSTLRDSTSTGTGGSPRPEDLASSDAPRTLRGPRVQVSGGFEAWKKSRITAALMDEADVPRDRAEDVASRVEERVFALGVKLLSTALIRELVDNELVELGLSAALRRQRPVGLPRHDLRRIVGPRENDRVTRERGDATSAGSGADVCDRVAGEILRRFALEDVLGATSAERHLSGEFFVEDLEHPHQALETSVPCDLLMRGEPTARSGFEMLEDVGDLLRGVSRGVVIEDPTSLCASLARVKGGALSSFLAGLGGVARAAGRRVDLSFSPATTRSTAAKLLGAGPAPASAVLARLCEDLGALEDEGRLRALPRVFLDAGEIVRLAQSSPALARVLDVHLSRGRVVPTWSSARARFAAPTLRRGPRERGVLHCGGAVAINLPRAARRAGPWREDALLENLAQTIESALDALHALREFQRQGPARANEMRGRTSYALVPVGLREALRWLADGELRAEQGARVLAFLVEATERFAAARNLSVTLAAVHGERAASRLCELDRDLFPLAQPLLFDDLRDAHGGAPAGASSSRRARGEPYGQGFELSAVDPGPASSAGVLGSGLAAVLSSLDCGALEPPSILRALSSGPASLAHPCLDALDKLERTRARLRAGAHALYALPRAGDDDSSPTQDGERGGVAESPDAHDLDEPGVPAACAADAGTLYPDEMAASAPLPSLSGHSTISTRHADRGETSRLES